jgi:hypothetical protein
MTEWGLQNKDASCPINDNERVPRLRIGIGLLRAYAAQGKLMGATYFDWGKKDDAKFLDEFSIYRCGELTPAGHVVLSR